MEQHSYALSQPPCIQYIVTCFLPHKLYRMSVGLVLFISNSSVTSAIFRKFSLGVLMVLGYNDSGSSNLSSEKNVVTNLHLLKNFDHWRILVWLNIIFESLIAGWPGYAVMRVLGVFQNFYAVIFIMRLCGYPHNFVSWFATFCKNSFNFTQFESLFSYN